MANGFHPPRRCATDDLLDEYRRFSRREAGLDPALGAVVGFSGGPDSTALLDLLLRAGTPSEVVVAAHLDHGLRAGSRAEASAAARVAGARGVRFVAERADVRALAAGSGRGVEATARRARYEFLARTAREAGLPVVLTGHHADDQAETVLLRLLRGTGPAGLAGIRPRRRLADGVDLARPLLPFAKARLLTYLDSRGLPFSEDPSNGDGTNLRSLVRTRLLPALERDAPETGRRLRRLADLAAGLGGSPPRDPGPIEITPEIARIPGRLRRRLRAALPEDGPPVDRRAVERVRERIAAGRGLADLGGGWSVLVRRGRLEVLPPATKTCRRPSRRS